MEEHQQAYLDTCDQCGTDLGDGEGWDGLCGNCADREEKHMDLQDVLRRLNEMDRQARTVGVNADDMLEEIRDLIADIENTIGEED